MSTLMTGQFFDDYALTMDAGDVDAMSAFCGKPTVFVSDKTKQICHNHEETCKINKLLLKSLQAGGVIKHTPRLVQSMSLSNNIQFCSVKWSFFDINEQVLFISNCSYTLQTSADNQMKIIVTVLDDDEKVISKLMAKYQENQ